jgi:hypothetical protein
MGDMASYYQSHDIDRGEYTEPHDETTMHQESKALTRIDDAEIVQSQSLRSKSLAMRDLDGGLSVEVLVERRNRVREVMARVMVEGHHYGKIPGCGDKPALLKPGAEILCMTFGLAPKFRQEILELGNGHREVRVTCSLETPSGRVVAEGLGSCSTWEKKYRWRSGQRVCPDCGKAAIIKGKEEYGGGWLCFGKKGGCGSKWPDGARVIEDQETGQVENPDAAEFWNTVLKMAVKRAHVAATLTATGASDILTQDIEDGTPDADPREYRSGHDAVDMAMQASDAQRAQDRRPHVGQTHRDWDPPADDRHRERDSQRSTEHHPEHDVIADKLIAQVRKADDAGIANVCDSPQAKSLPEAQKVRLRQAIRDRRHELKSAASSNGAAA